MLVVSRFTVPEPEGGRFAELAEGALAALAARPGFRRGHAGRSVDDPAEWVLVSEWDGVGAYRRALGTYEVKLAATPLLAQARDESGAFEELVTADSTGVTATARSDRAPDADSAAPGDIRTASDSAAPARSRDASAPGGIPGADSDSAGAVGSRGASGSGGISGADADVRTADEPAGPTPPARDR